MNRPLVFLDIDNTVLDFNTAEEKALKRVFLENGLPADDAVPHGLHHHGPPTLGHRPHQRPYAGDRGEGI